jgi:hypothetical protein
MAAIHGLDHLGLGQAAQLAAAAHLGRRRLSLLAGGHGHRRVRHRLWPPAPRRCAQACAGHHRVPAVQRPTRQRPRPQPVLVCRPRVVVVLGALLELDREASVQVELDVAVVKVPDPEFRRVGLFVPLLGAWVPAPPRRLDFERLLLFLRQLHLSARQRVLQPDNLGLLPPARSEVDHLVRVVAVLAQGCAPLCLPARTAPQLQPRRWWRAGPTLHRRRGGRHCTLCSTKTQNLSFQKKKKVRFDMERRECLNLEPVTFVVT